MEIHKNQEGIYTIQFFDKYGRYIKEEDMLAETLDAAIADGKAVVEGKEDVKSFLVKRNVYNSVDHL